MAQNAILVLFRFYIYGMDRTVFEKKYGMTTGRVAFLVGGFLRQVLNDQEQDELDDWITTDDANQELFEDLIEPDRFEKETPGWYETGVGDLRSKIEATLYDTPVKKIIPAKIIWYTATAACAAIIIFFVLTHLLNQPGWITQTVKRPTLILPDGTRKTLGENPGDSLLYKNQVVVYNESPGLLQYSLTGNGISGDKYHVFHVPEGFSYRIMLSDRTRVWVNGGTVMRFLEIFNSKERVVELRGEAYFEIKDNARPFIIKFSDGEVISCGGHVDVKDYKGSESAVVLASGDALLKGKSSELQMKRNCRATIGEKGKIVMIETDIEPYIGWRKEVLKWGEMRERSN
jgi:transmembrane sensor